MPYCFANYKSSQTFADDVSRYDNSACVHTTWLNIAKTVIYASPIELWDLITSVLG
jgi:hypothetical protein